MASDNRTLTGLRRLLFVTLAIGMAGTLAELLLLDHVEGWQQLMPVVLIVAGLCVAGWHAAAPGAASARTLQMLMLLFIVSGVAGVVLHYRGNVEFELEMYPSLGGTELFAKTMTGATPVLAPGTMLLLGLIGLAHTYRHPGLTPRDTGVNGEPS